MAAIQFTKLDATPNTLVYLCNGGNETGNLPIAQILLDCAEGPLKRMLERAAANLEVFRPGNAKFGRVVLDIVFSGEGSGRQLPVSKAGPVVLTNTWELAYWNGTNLTADGANDATYLDVQFIVRIRAVHSMCR